MLCALNDSAESLFAFLSNGDIDTESRDHSRQTLEEICKDKAPRCTIVLNNFKDPASLGDHQQKPNENEFSSTSSYHSGPIQNTPRKNHEIIQDIMKKLTKSQVARTLEELTISKLSLEKNMHPLLQGLPQKSNTFQILSQNIVSGQNYSDKDFPHNLKSLSSDPKHPLVDIYTKAVWRRPHEILGIDYNQIKLYDVIDPFDLQ